MAYCYQWLEYWTLIVQWFSRDEWNMAPALLTWSCSLFYCDSDTRSFSKVVVDADWYLIPAKWPQSCRWIFIGLWLYWGTDTGSERPVSSDMVTGSNWLLKLWIAVLHPVNGAKLPSFSVEGSGAKNSVSDFWWNFRLSLDNPYHLFITFVRIKHSIQSHIFALHKNDMSEIWSSSNLSLHYSYYLFINLGRI